MKPELDGVSTCEQSFGAWARTGGRAARITATAGFFIVLCAAGLGGGCKADLKSEPQSDPGITKTASKGPVDVSLTARPASIPFDQRARVTLEITADKGVTILDSEFAAALTAGDRSFQYRVADRHEEPARPTDDGRLRWTYQFDLEFFLSGEHEIPGAEVSFVDLSQRPVDGADAAPVSAVADVQTVTTDPLTVVVRQDEGFAPTEAELRSVPRLDPIELTRKRTLWWWVAPVLLAAVIMALVLMRRRRRRAESQLALRIPAHEWARAQLSRLVAQDLIAKQRFQDFYYGISGIVRGYIERRFAVSAPEMTTEEFLTAASTHGQFGEQTTEELNRFLTACDLVKYACHRPASDEPDAVLRAASDFVERTRRREMPQATGGTDGSSAGERAA